MLPSLANLERDTGTTARKSREGTGTEENEPKRARKERRTPILVNGEWVRHYRHTPLNDVSIRRAVEALVDPGQAAAVVAEYGPVAEWDTSKVKNFSRLFDVSGSPNIIYFNADLSGWDVGKVKDMKCMFQGATSFTSDLSKWNVGKATNMDSMFVGATSFTSDLSRWNVGKVERMQNMFLYATSFTSDLSKWDVGNVKDMERMFNNATSFTSDLSKWDVGNVKTMAFMFRNATSFTSDLSRWNVGKVEIMQHMFQGATSFTSDLSKWNVGKATNMDSMFQGATSFTSDLSKWNVGNVEDMSYMFLRATSFTSDLSKWNVGKATNMDSMFAGAESFGPSLEQGADRGWKPESLARHEAFVESSPVLKTYRARRRWREVRELWSVARSVVRALLRWTEQRCIDEKRYDSKNPAVRQQLEDELEELQKNIGLREGFAPRVRRLCEILLQTNPC